MTDKKKEAIDTLFHLEHINTYLDLYKNHNVIIESDTILKWKNATQTVLSMLKEKDKELEKKNKIINNAIIEIENLRQYFSEDLQPDFIGILEILKDKKVIDW